MATTRQPTKAPASQPASTGRTIFMFDRMNYYILGAGLLLLAIGYLLMAGGQQQVDSFNPEEIYSFRRITLAPIVVLLGYGVVVYGIMKRPVE